MIKREASSDEVKIVGFRVEEAEKEPEIENGVPVLRAATKIMFRLFGIGFKNTTTIGLTTEKLDYGSSCNMMVATGLFKIIRESSTNAKVEVLLPEYSAELYICATHEDSVSERIADVSLCCYLQLLLYRSLSCFIIKAVSHG